MKDIEIQEIEDVDAQESVLIEGLPGVGHVGKLVAEHLIEELESTLVLRIYSNHLPPQCKVDDDGVVSLVSAELYHCKVESGDLMVLSGDHQSQTVEGHYKITEAILDICSDLGVSKVFTLGGIATGELVEEYSVVGASNDSELIPGMEEIGVNFGEGEPKGGIIGVSGLLLGMGGLRDIPGVCLMGETSGYMVDPKSAQAVLEVLMEALDFEVGMQELEDRAEEMEEVVKQIEDMTREAEGMPFPADEDLRYIG